MIDHLVYAAPDLAAAVDDLAARFGVRAQAGGRHVGLGTHNALLALGAGTYMEVIAPDPDQPPPTTTRPFGLDGLTHGRLAGWAIARDDIDAAIAYARDHGYDPGDAVEMRRVGSTGTVRWRMTLNAFDGGPVPYLIAWGDSEHPSRSAPDGLVLDSFTIEHSDPASLASVLTALKIDIDLKPGSRTVLIADTHGPNGRKVLR
jgi:Glyoxalase-like domain